MKRIFCLSAATLLLTALFASCGPAKSNQPADKTKLLEINLLEAGYGRQFMDDMAAAYMNKHKDVKIEIEASPAYGTAEAAILAGPSVTTTDLFVQWYPKYRSLAEKKGLVEGYDYILEDLTDLYNSKPDGEERTIKEKMFPDFEQAYRSGDKYFAFPWACDPNGLIYNVKLFKDNSWALPRTTNELLETAEKIADSGKNIKPFIWAGSVGYWTYVHTTWWAQYEGTENFRNFWQVKDNSNKVFLQQGRLEAMKVLDAIVNPSYKNNKLNYPGGTVLGFMDAQMKFLESEAAMIPNGGWLENEMKNNFEPGEVDISFMKTPIISALGEKLGISEAQLREVVDYVDGVSTAKPQGVSDEQIETVKDARNMVHTSGNDFAAIIPSYADGKEIAKDFLRFMASDEGISIYSANTRGILPFQYDIEKNAELNAKLTTFQKNKYAIMKNPNLVFVDYSHPLFYKTDLIAYNANRIPEQVFGATNPADRKTPEDLIQAEYKWTLDRWSDLLTQAGLS